MSLQGTFNGRDGQVNKAVLKDSHYVTVDVKLVRAVTYLVRGRRGTKGPDLQADSDDGIKTAKESFENIEKYYLVWTVTITNGEMRVLVLRKRVFPMGSLRF